MRTIFALLMAGSIACIACGSSQAQWAGLTVGAAANQILREVENTITAAMQQGDYLMARAAIHAKDSIDAWKIANSELLDKAFSELNATQRDLFVRSHALITKVNSNVTERMESAQRIMEAAQDIAENLPLGGGRTFATRYGPRIIPGGDEVILTIRGVNFDGADPQLRVDGRPVERTSLTQNDIQFVIPSELNANTGSTLLRKNLKFTYTVPAAAWYSRLVGGRNLVERDISLIILPEKFATFSYIAKSKLPTKESMQHTADLGQFKGRNRRIYKVANPPAGYKWDLSQPYSHSQGRGEAGRCEGFDTNASSENGLSFFAHVDEIRDRRNFGGLIRKDGYVSCQVIGTVYRVVDREIEHPAQKGSLEWGADVPIKKPANTISQILTVTLFNGETDISVGDAHGKFHEVTDARDAIIISPLPPPADAR